MRIRILLILFMLSGLSINANAQAYYPQGPYQGQGEQQNPGVLLHDGIEKLLAFMQGGGARHRDKLVAFVNRDLAPYFDFVSMTYWSLGPRARYMNQAQLVAAVKQVRSMFLQSLVRNMMSYDPGRVQYLPPRGDPYRGEIILSAQSIPKSGYPMRLDFYFQRSEKGWRVFDVAANGIRATTVYREMLNERPRGWRYGN